MNNPFFIFSLIFGLAVFGGFVFRLFHQPSFLGHVIVGLVAGYFGFGTSGIGSLIEILSSSGVMLLLFMVGLEMNVFEVKSMGMKVFWIGILQILSTFLLFGSLSYVLGLGLIESLFSGLILSFSSTIIVVKLLSEKHDLTSLFGRLAVALLLIQDICAIILLMVFGDGNRSGVLGLLIKALFLVGFIVFGARKVMPRITKYFAKTIDELILFSLAWCFVFSSIVSLPYIGLSLEIGGFLAGLALSGTIEHLHIATKIKPIRDFFLTIFFVSLGLGLRVSSQTVALGLGLSVAILFLKPVIIWVILRLFGYKQRIAFGTAILFGQVSEFGYILLNIGQRSGIIGESTYSLVSIVGLVTMICSSYVILDADKLYRTLRSSLNKLWKDSTHGSDVEQSLEGHVILFGCHRMGRSVLGHLVRNKEKILIVDFDSEVVNGLLAEGFNAVYADASDSETYERISINKSKLIISTLQDVRDTMVILSEVRKRKLHVAVVVEAETTQDAQTLYKAGASYVIYPHFVGGLHLGDLVRKGVSNKDDFEIYRRSQQEAMLGVYA